MPTNDDGLPAEDALRGRVEEFLAGADPAAGTLTASLRAEIELAFGVLYREENLPRAGMPSHGLEAVTIADGSRPVFFVTNDKLVQGAAGNGPFVDLVHQHASMLEKAALAVGRIETDDKFPPAGLDKFYDGTAFLVAPDIAMTNRHVLERIVDQPASTAGPFTLNARYWLNFGAQVDSTLRRRFRITRVLFAGPDVIGRGGDFARLDLALLEIGDPETAGFARPEPLALTFDDVLLEQPIAVIGYPAPPPITLASGTPTVGSELEDVLRRLFDERFGFKRCASGEVDRQTGSPRDTQGWTIEHDCSTLNGNSGSPVVLLGGAAPRVSALHFGGVPRESNFAHAFKKIVPQLRSAGVPVQAP